MNTKNYRDWRAHQDWCDAIGAIGPTAPAPDPFTRRVDRWVLPEWLPRLWWERLIEAAWTLHCADIPWRTRDRQRFRDALTWAAAHNSRDLPYTREPMPPEIRYAMDDVQLLLAVIHYGPEDGLRFLGGDAAAAGYRVREGGRKGADRRDSREHEIRAKAQELADHYKPHNLASAVARSLGVTDRRVRQVLRKEKRKYPP